MGSCRSLSLNWGKALVQGWLQGTTLLRTGVETWEALLGHVEISVRYVPEGSGAEGTLTKLCLTVCAGAGRACSVCTLHTTAHADLPSRSAPCIFLEETLYLNRKLWVWCRNYSVKVWVRLGDCHLALKYMNPWLLHSQLSTSHKQRR